MYKSIILSQEMVAAAKLAARKEKEVKRREARMANKLNSRRMRKLRPQASSRREGGENSMLFSPDL